jgi:hypothetical protein
MLGRPGRASSHRPPMHRPPSPRRTRSWVPIAVAGIVLTSATAASAYWSGDGSGSGQGTSSAGATLAISPGTPTSLLRPGTTADVTVTISNASATAVELDTIALAPAGTTVDAAHSACGTSAVTYTPQTSGWTIPARTGATDGTLTVILPDALAMGAGALDSCQGAQFTVNLTGVGP